MAKKTTKTDTPANTGAANQGQVNVSGNVMFYSNPQPLTKEAFGGKGVTQLDKPFAYMAEHHFIPLTASELGSAANSFPIIFAGENKALLGVMGIRAGENLFVEDGIFNQDFYLPAFARRYPFVLAGDKANDRFVVCVDADADCVSDKNLTQPFFDGDDTSAYTKEAFDFLQNFERDRQATDQMIEEFKKHDLFEQKEMNFQGVNPDGSPAAPQRIADYFAVTEDRLRKLDAATLKSFNDRGFLAVAHAHMMSLNNWQRLVNMALRRQPQAAAA